MSSDQNGGSTAKGQPEVSGAIELPVAVNSRETPTQYDPHLYDVPTLVPGNTLGSFRILQHIASGGMGQVYRASDQRLGRDVAIKILPRTFARDPALLSRFQAEARAASSLNHPNIVAIHDIGAADDLCWIVSELVDGHSLRWVLEAAQLTSRRVIEIATQIAEGLSAAHAAGFIHRDLKPENIMLTRENRVKILDFGLAKSAVRISGNVNVTQEGVVLGTPGYMSPEQIAGDPIDERSDIFSLGVILYEMLTRKRPFTGKDRVTVMQATLTEDAPPLPPSIPPGLTRITERCLEKQPGRRLQSATDLAFALQMLMGSSIRTPVPRLRWPSRRIPFPRKAAIAAGLAIAAAALFWAGVKFRPPEPLLPGTMRRLTWDSALTTDGAISPDGQLVAYASDRANGKDLNIFVQQVDGGVALQLTNNAEANDEPTFSPDGSRIAYESRLGVGGIHQVSVLGGEARLIAAGGRHPRFSPDGHFIVYGKVGSEASLYGGWGAQLFVQPISGGTPALITQGCAHVVAEAVWSPDSEHVLAAATCDGILDLWLISRDGKTRTRTNGATLWQQHQFNSGGGLTFQRLDQWLNNPPRILLPLSEGDIKYEVAAPVSTSGLKFFEPVSRINFGPATTVHGSASTGGRIALTAYEHSANLWELPFDIHGRTAGKAVQITNSQGVLIHPAVSQDGRYAAFVLTHAGRDELQVLNLESRASTPVTLQTGSIKHPAFSPNGEAVSYEADHESLQTGIHGGVAVEICRGGDAHISDWSSDGSQFLMVRRPLDQTTVVSSVDLATSKETVILKAPGQNLYQAHYSSDGKYVTFNATRNEHSRIYAALLRTGPTPASDWIPLTDGTTWDDKPRLSPDGKLLFFVSDRDGFPCIWVQPVTRGMQLVGKPEAAYHSHLLRRSLSSTGIGDMELNVTAKRLIFTQGETLGNIWVLDPPASAK